MERIKTANTHQMGYLEAIRDKLRIFKLTLIPKNESDRISQYTLKKQQEELNLLKEKMGLK